MHGQGPEIDVGYMASSPVPATPPAHMQHGPAPAADVAASPPQLSPPGSIQTSTPTLGTAHPQDPPRSVTRAMHGIHCPRKRTDGTVAWLAACMARSVADPSAEPRHFRAALGVPHW